MDTFNKSYVIAFPLDLVFSKWVAEDTIVSPAEKMEIDLGSVEPADYSCLGVV